MNVLLVCPSYPPYRCGVGDYVSLLHNQLTQAGEQVEVLTSAPDRGLPGVHAIMPENWTVNRLGAILEQIARIQPEIVHIQYPAAGYRHGMVALLPWAIKRRFPKLKLCLTFHELHRERWRSKLESFVAVGAANAIIFTTHYDYHYFRGRAGRVRGWDQSVLLATIPVASSVLAQPSVSRAEMRRRLNLADDDVLLVFFGFVRPDKQVEVLLEAFEQLLGKYPRLHLTLYADLTDAHRDDAATLRYRQRLQPALARLQALTPRLHHQHYAEDARLLSSALTASDIGVLPFRNGVYENSTVLMSMLGHGLPVITTAGDMAPPDLSQVVYLAATNDANGIANAISALIERPDERTRLRQAACAWLHTHDWTQVIQRHQSLYATLARIEDRG